MSFKHFGALSRSVEDNIRRNSPSILMGLGIAGMFAAMISAVRVTPKALGDIENAKKDYKKEQLSKKELVKATYKRYIPAAATSVAATACLIGSASISNRRNAALATAYSLSETAFRTYREKVVEAVGQQKEQAVRDEVAKEQLARNPMGAQTVILAGDGEVLCFDATSGRYFTASVDRLRRAEHTINKRLRLEMYVSLNEFYYEIGLPPVKMGDDLGWNIDKHDLELRFSSHLTEKEAPCLVLDYYVYPNYKLF